MVLDTSALVAVVFDEPERQRLSRAIAASTVRLISAATLVEAAMVVEGRRGREAGAVLDSVVHRIGPTCVPVDQDQAKLATTAWRRFGKGRHPAGLNFGDCFAYALAVASHQPLLFKGDDFSRTDVDAVVY